jgi:spermidine synthase
MRIDVVELDPGITALARSHFGLTDHPRLTIIEEDARTFLKKVDRPYDVILCDVFNSHYSIPFHLVTVEAIQLMREALSPDGVILVNLLASPEGVSSRFYKALHATFRTAFPSVQSYAVVDAADRQLWQNMLLVAGTSGLPEKEPEDPALRRMHTHALPAPDDSPPPFTDEYAPVDRFIGELSLRTAARSDS